MRTTAMRVLLIGLLCGWSAAAAWAQGEAMRRAVYYDRRYPGSWISGGQSLAARSVFSARGYTSLNADELKTWMQERITDGVPSVVVFLHDMPPDTIVETVTPDATMRRYLEAGGRVVWSGDVPLYYVGLKTGKNQRLQARGSRQVLGLNCDWTPYGEAEGLECSLTDLGGVWGLKNTFTSYRPVSPSLVDRIFAVQSNGLPSAWGRRYGAPPRAGMFLRTHDTFGMGNLDDLQRLAEYVEPLQTPPSPGGDFSDVTAGAFAAPDADGSVTGRWLRIGIGAYPNPGGARRGTSDLTFNPSPTGGRSAWRLGVRSGAQRGHIEWYVESAYVSRDSDTPAFVSVEYFDGTAGVLLGLEYSAGTSTFRPARGVVVLRGTGRWRRATWYLPDARWDKLFRSSNVNSGNDFRLYVSRGPTAAASGAYVASIRVLTERQAALRLPPERRLTFSATRDGVAEADLTPFSDELRAAAPFIRATGATSHQSPVFWSRIEKEPGVFDFAFYDAIVALHRELGLKWSPILTLGPPASLPDWYRDSTERQGFVCLEHGQTSPIPSLWDPSLREHVRAFLKAFGERYRDTGVLESVVLGISGVTGEARYPTTRPPITGPGNPGDPYHSHDGYWAGDPFAVASFQQAMQAKYGAIAALNAAWGTTLAGFATLRPFLPSQGSLAARRDLAEWYTGSMLDYARFWLTTARELMPDVDLQIRTGGDGAPEHGSDFAALAQLAAQYQAGIRLMNDSGDYVTRFATSRWLDGAARFFRTSITYEASREVSTPGVIARIYNAASSAVRGLKEGAAWFDSPETFDTWLTQSRLFQGWPAATEVAFFYPQAHVTLFGSAFLERELLPAISELRGQFDFDLVSESMIAAGALDRYRALVIGPGDIWDRETLDRITAWVRAGGLLVAPERIDQGFLYPNLVRGGARALGSGHVAIARDDGAYAAFVRATLLAEPTLSGLTRVALAAGDPDLGLFATALPPSGLLLLNTADEPITRDLPPGSPSRSITLPPLSIVPVVPAP
jgi:hypothetical protein